MSLPTLHLVQSELTWEDPAANRTSLGNKIAGLHEGIVILPEMFSTGFSMASETLAEAMDGATIGWMKKIARDSGITLCGSLIIEDAGKFYNRFLWVTSDGNVQTYDKRHLFRMADEHDHYSPGNALPFFKIGELTLAPQVCYDLRFPAWSRNTTDNPYDVLLYVANWPAARREQWLSLLKARAIENLCYVVAVNRIGRDGNDVTYAGDSCVIDFRGETLVNLADQDTIASIELDRQSLDDYRREFPAYLDADRFSIDI